jgi:transcriptional regulator with XRE-family HTH domain
MATETRPEEDAPLATPELAEIGGRIRNYRQIHGWTLDALASRAKLSKSYISRLEDGDRQPSIAALLSISRALGTSLGSLLSGETSASSFHIVNGADQPAISGNGLVYQQHSGSFPGAIMQPIRMTISAERTGNELYRHDGEEWLYVLSGQLTVTIGEDNFSLDPGDSIHFEATVGHRLSADNGKDVEAILVASVAPKALLRSYI